MNRVTSILDRLRFLARYGDSASMTERIIDAEVYYTKRTHESAVFMRNVWRAYQGRFWYRLWFVWKTIRLGYFLSPAPGQLIEDWFKRQWILLQMLKHCAHDTRSIHRALLSINDARIPSNFDIDIRLRPPHGFQIGWMIDQTGQWVGITARTDNKDPEIWEQELRSQPTCGATGS